MGGYIKRDVQRIETTALNTQVNAEKKTLQCI